MALTDIGASCAQERVGKLVAGVGIANADGLPGIDAVGQILALIDIENRILAHHRDQARRRVIVLALLANLQLLHEIDLGAVLALAHVAAQLQSLLERQKARRAIACRLCHPQQDDVASRIRPIGYGIAWRVRAGRRRPWLYPRGGTGFQFCNNAR